MGSKYSKAAKAMELSEEQLQMLKIIKEDFDADNKKLHLKIEFLTSEVMRMMKMEQEKWETYEVNTMRIMDKWINMELEKDNIQEVQADTISESLKALKRWQDRYLAFGERQRRDTIEDIIDDIDTSNYINYTYVPPFQFDSYPCMTSKTVQFDEVEIMAGTGCFLTIMALLIAIYYKINKIITPMSRGIYWPINIQIIIQCINLMLYSDKRKLGFNSEQKV